MSPDDGDEAPDGRSKPGEADGEPGPTRTSARGGSSDPTVLHTVAVTAEDLVTAYEARVRRDEPVVLRVTPPFSGRMRARLHIERPGEYAATPGPSPLHFDPARLLDEDVPAFPSPMDTEDELRAVGRDPEPEAHREYHEAAVERWRAAVRGGVRDRLTLTLDGDQVTVDVVLLG